MKKWFYFRSSGGSSNNQVSPDGNDKCRSKSVVTEKHAVASGPFLGRSRSTSSGAVFDGGCGWKDAAEQVESPRSSGHGSGKKLGRNSFRRAATPEKQHPQKSFEVAARKADKRGPVPGLHYESSDCDSYSSSNVSTGVLDRYIDGEPQPAKCASHRMLSSADFFENGNFLMEQQKPKCQSFRDIDASKSHFSSRDWPQIGGFGNESTRKIAKDKAKDVVESLSKLKFLPPKSSREPDFDVPITVEDVYSQPLSRSPHRIPLRNSALDESTLDESALDESALDGFKGSFDAYLYEATKCEVNSSDFAVDDQKLFRQFKEAEDRAILFSEEFEQHPKELSPPSMVHTIRGLNAQRENMAYETVNILKNWITDRTSLREEVQMAKAELETKTRRLEKEKSELQLVLERELDRRSNEWSNKLDKYQSEEHRLRERVRELAEQNVSLQREISSFNERETGLRNRATRSEQQVMELTLQVEQVKGDNRNLKQNLSDIQEKCKVAEEDRDCLSRNYEEKVNECKDLHRSITRLQRTCGEHEKSIDGLRSLCEEIQKNKPTDSHLKKLQLEHLRLTGIEYALRKEVESSRTEVASLRHENINLLNRLKETGKEGGFSTFKIDQELWHRIGSLQNQGLSYLADCAQLCRNLLEYIKRNSRQNTQGGLDGDGLGLGLGSQFIAESEVKLQGFSRGVENLTKSLSVVSTVLQEKSTVLLAKSEPATVEAESSRFNHKKSMDIILSELRAETLMTTLLREKLYSKDLEIEQLQAEVAASVRGNDIIKSQVQNAVDTISCLTHQRKELELQMMKKDQNINQLQSELQDCNETLADVKGKLPKVEQERNMLWDEVKMYNEKNMLLNCEMSMLKKKIDAMDEDRLIKEGQITILKDALDKQPFDLLGNADHEFLVR